MRLGAIPPGRTGLILLAAAVAPIILKKFKPVAKAVSRTLKRAGEAVEKFAEENGVKPASETQTATAEAKGSEVKQDVPKTTTASPTGQEEVTAQKTANAEPQAEPKVKQPAAKKSTRPAAKGATAPQNNPKRSRRTPPPDVA